MFADGDFIFRIDQLSSQSLDCQRESVNVNKRERRRILGSTVIHSVRQSFCLSKKGIGSLAISRKSLVCLVWLKPVINSVVVVVR